MPYSIANAAQIIGVSASTLRYYDKEGLLPDVKRTSNGSRIFSDADLSWIRIIGYLKEAGLTIKEIRRYTELVQQGDSSLEARRNLLYERRKAVQEDRDRIQRTLDFITYKCWFYDEAVRLGSEEAVQALPESEIPAEILDIYQNCLAH